jgi:hypothetical protein
MAELRTPGVHYRADFDQRESVGRKAVCPIECVVQAEAIPLGDRLYRIRVTAVNETKWFTASDPPASVMGACQFVMRVQQGRFVSSADPSLKYKEHAKKCNNLGVWPALLGDPSREDTMIAASMILPDYPAVAPESPGDLYDSTEIDELLTLRILTLTDEEKASAARRNSAVGELIRRSHELHPDQLRCLHGTLRGSCDSKAPPPSSPASGDRVSDLAIGAGSKVRLRPRQGQDVLDVALEGLQATVVSVEQNFEDEFYVAVTLDDDPGNDLGLEGRPGHRFFFRLDEIELLGG